MKVKFFQLIFFSVAFVIHSDPAYNKPKKKDCAHWIIVNVYEFVTDEKGNTVRGADRHAIYLKKSDLEARKRSLMKKFGLREKREFDKVDNIYFSILRRGPYKKKATAKLAWTRLGLKKTDEAAGIGQAWIDSPCEDSNVPHPLG